MTYQSEDRSAEEIRYRRCPEATDIQARTKLTAKVVDFSELNVYLPPEAVEPDVELESDEPPTDKALAPQNCAASR
jgi:hypothetical protein